MCEEEKVVREDVGEMDGGGIPPIREDGLLEAVEHAMVLQLLRQVPHP